MIREGQIVLFHFPQTDQPTGKVCSALVLRKLPGPYDDWLICMISTHLSQQIEGLDEIITSDDSDFGESGLKAPSLFRISPLAVIDKSILLGAIGTISADRLFRIKTSLLNWIKGT